MQQARTKTMRNNFVVAAASTLLVGAVVTSQANAQQEVNNTTPSFTINLENGPFIAEFEHLITQRSAENPDVTETFLATGTEPVENIINIHRQGAEILATQLHDGVEIDFNINYIHSETGELVASTNCQTVARTCQLSIYPSASASNNPTSTQQNNGRFVDRWVVVSLPSTQAATNKSYRAKLKTLTF